MDLNIVSIIKFILLTIWEIKKQEDIINRNRIDEQQNNRDIENNIKEDIINRNRIDEQQNNRDIENNVKEEYNDDEIDLR